MLRWLRSFVWLGVAVLAAATTAGFYGDVSRVLDLAAHFRPHLVVASFVWLFLALVQRRPMAVIACATLLAVNAAPLVPYVITPEQPTVATGSPLRVMTYNMHGRATRRAAFIEFVHGAQPDVIVLTEVPPDDGWLTDSLGADYPHHIDGNSGRPHDLMLCSRWPIMASQIDRGVDDRLPVLTADLCEEDTRQTRACLRLVGLHAIGPFGGLAARHDAQLDLAVRHVTQAPRGDALLIGDLNMTPWARGFRRLRETSGLEDAARGHGVTATWLSRQPMVGLAIDHVLTSARIAVRDYRVGPDLGSDHLPVIAGLTVPRPAQTAIRPPQ